MGQTREQRIIKQISGQNIQKQTPIATDMFLPNHSGDLSAGKVLKTPTQDLNPVNKKYVDDAITAALGSVWLTATDQTLLTGDKSGSFDLLTTGAGAIGTITKSGSLTINGLTGTKAKIATFTDGGTDDPQVYVYAGKALRPGYSFLNDIDTGMYSASADNINFSTGQILRLTINSTNILTPVPFKTTIATGTAPIQVTSTTLNTNLNADLLDGKHATDILGPGHVSIWGGTIAQIPTGWLLCDGSAVSRTTYADLFSAISTTWGAGDGSTTFNLPDLRDKFIVGAKQDSGGVPKTNITGSLTQDGGNVTHTHSFTTNGHDHSSQTGLGYASLNLPTQSADTNGGGSTSNFVYAGNDDGHSHSISNVTDSGTTDSENGLPPYWAMAFIIKT